MDHFIYFADLDDFACQSDFIAYIIICNGNLLHEENTKDSKNSENKKLLWDSGRKIENERKVPLAKLSEIGVSISPVPRLGFSRILNDLEVFLVVRCSDW